MICKSIVQNATIHIKVKPEIAKGLKELSKKRETSVGELVRQALLSCYQIELLSLGEKQRRALEAFLGGYISMGKLAEEMGSNIWETRKWLHEHNFSLCPLIRTEHDYFRGMITFLGHGEASCIAFARDRNAIVATDDRIARKQCANMKIPVTGTIGILKASVQDSMFILEQANDVLDRMIASGFYSPVNSITDIL